MTNVWRSGVDCVLNQVCVISEGFVGRQSGCSDLWIIEMIFVELECDFAYTRVVVVIFRRGELIEFAFRQFRLLIFPLGFLESFDHVAWSPSCQKLLLYPEEQVLLENGEWTFRGRLFKHIVEFPPPDAD